MPIGLNVITHSRQSKYKFCPRAHWLAYEQGIRAEDPGEPLRGGAAFHDGLDDLNQLGDLDHACSVIYGHYAEVPRWAEAYEWACEAEKFIRLLCGYEWRWRDDGLKVIASEFQFELPIVNPETEMPSRTFVRGGKIDAIVQLPDGRIAVEETKTTSEPLDDDSDYWRRLRRDEQISGYMDAARKCGFAVETVLYDAIHKPQLRPLRATPPELRKYTKDGRLYANQRECDESPHEYGDRIAADIVERPDHYYVRKEIPRLESDLRQYEAELWQTARQIREAELKGFWFRNTNACCTIGRQCEFHKDICDMDIDATTPLPRGWRRVEVLHEELENARNHESAAGAAAHEGAAAGEPVSAS